MAGITGITNINGNMQVVTGYAKVTSPSATSISASSSYTLPSTGLGVIGNVSYSNSRDRDISWKLPSSGLWNYIASSGGSISVTVYGDDIMATSGSITRGILVSGGSQVLNSTEISCTYVRIF